MTANNQTKKNHLLRNAVAAAVMSCGGAHSAEFIVQTTGDTGGGIANLISGNTYSVDTLRSAIEQANSLAFPDADVITFDSSITAGGAASISLDTVGDTVSVYNQSSDSGLGIDSNITISGPSSGPGIALTTASTLRLFQVNGGGQLTLNHLTLSGARTNTNYAGRGGAVAVLDDGVLYANNCTFDDNRARRGSAVAFLGNSTQSTLVNSVFSNNETFAPVGFQLNSGGAIDVESESMATIENSHLTNNSSNYGGGAIFASGTVVVRNSTISANSAYTNGGGIDTNNVGFVKMYNSTVSDNTAEGQGGGIFLGSGDYGTNNLIVNSTITGNSATINYAPAMRTLHRGSAAIYSGGGGIIVSNNYNNTIIHNTIITNNVETSAATANDLAAFLNPLSSNNLIGVDVETNNISNGVNGNQIGTLAQPLDALLGPLSDNGGMTMTYPLLSGSPAINAGNNTEANNAGLLTDQRGVGFDRIIGQAVDIGAFETDVIFVNGFE